MQELLVAEKHDEQHPDPERRHRPQHEGAGGEGAIERAVLPGSQQNSERDPDEVGDDETDGADLDGDRQAGGYVLYDRLLILEGTAEIQGCEPHPRTLVEQDPGAVVFPRFDGLDREHKARHPAGVLFVQRTVESQLPAKVGAGSLQLVPLVGGQPLSAGSPPQEEVHRIPRGEVHDQERNDGDPNECRDRQQKTLNRVLDHFPIIAAPLAVPRGLGMDRFSGHSSRAAAVS